MDVRIVFTHFNPNDYLQQTLRWHVIQQISTLVVNTVGAEAATQVTVTV